MPHDYLADRAANYRLMQNIREWWKRRGFIVNVWLEKANSPQDNSVIWVIRTNITQNVKHAGTRYSLI